MENNKFLIVAFVILFFLASFLRLYNIIEVPPGLYIDEAAIGVNADSILRSGKDEWGAKFPLWFKSFGDYKMPLYIYATSFSMAIFGKTEFAIRFPSILAGLGTIVILFFFTRDLILFDKDEKNRKLFSLLPILSMLVLSIMPWHIHFSRGGFEVNLALFLYFLASWLIVRFLLYKKDFYVVLSLLSYAASIYTYHSFRIISPLTVMIILGLFMVRRVLFTQKIIAGLSLFILMCVPVFFFSFSPEGSARLSQTSAFTEYPTASTLEKLSLYPLVFIKNYLSFFSLDFLFSFGDGNGRHQIPNFGVLGRWQLPFLIIGIIALLKKKNSAFIFVIIAFLLLAPLPAAITRPSPHSLRSLLFVIPYALMTSFGLYTLLTMKSKVKIVAILGSLCIILFDFLFYWHFYMNHYPKVNLLDWGAGNKEMVLKTKKLSTSYDKVIIDDYLSNTEIYYKFYNDLNVPEFVSSDWRRTPELKTKKILYVRPNYANPDKTDRVDAVYFPNINHDIYVEFWNVK